MNAQSKKHPTGPTERTPKPEYLIALGTYFGVRGKGPIQFWMDTSTEAMLYIPKDSWNLKSLDISYIRQLIIRLVVPCAEGNLPENNFYKFFTYYIDQK